MTLRADRGFAVTELIVAASLLILIVGLATARWESRGAHLRLRYATLQVVSDLRHVRDTARDSSRPQAVIFTAGGSEYTAARPGEWIERVLLPEGVTTAAANVVTFSPLGPVATPVVITLSGPAGRNIINVSVSGAISYTIP